MFRTTELGCGSFGGFLKWWYPQSSSIFLSDFPWNKPTSELGDSASPFMESPFHQWPFQEPIDWRYLPYIRPIFQAYAREYPHNSYGQTYGTNVPPSVGSWRSPSDFTSSFNNRGSDDGRVGQGPYRALISRDATAWWRRWNSTSWGAIKLGQSTRWIPIEIVDVPIKSGDVP